MTSLVDQIAQLEHALREQMGEIDRLRAIIDQKDVELDAVVAWIAGDEDALGTLRSVYVDPRTSVPNKVKAASSALPFERSKPASVSVIVDFKSRVHDARMQTVELRKQEWTRQEPLGLDAPTSPTILGGDHEGEALGPDPAA
jgi:hypothetical protein